MKKNNKTINKSYNKQLLASSILLIIALVMFSASLVALQSSRPNIYERGVYVPSTVIAANKVNLQINNISYSAGEDNFKAPENMQFVILDTTFQNNYLKSINILPSSQTYLKDNDGKVYYLTPAALENPFRAGELMAGDNISGQLSYLVPTNKSYKFYIDAIWSGGVISVQLNNPGN